MLVSRRLLRPQRSLLTLPSASLARVRHYTSHTPQNQGFFSRPQQTVEDQLISTYRSDQRSSWVLPLKIVPQGQVWIKERFGRFKGIMEPGMHVLVPGVDVIAMRFSTKEIAYPIGYQTAITKDNVVLNIDGVVFFRIVDAHKSAYEISNPYSAIVQLAQTTMRAEIGKINLDRSFSERQRLNESIVEQLQKTAEGWGIQVNRYEIMNIDVPAKIKESMDLEAAAERQKRKTVLESLGVKESRENVAMGEKLSRVLHAEASRIEREESAKAEVFSIKQTADATAMAIERVAAAMAEQNGDKAVSYQVARDYIEAFSKLAKEGNTLILPANVNDAGSMVAQAMTVYQNINNSQKKDESGSYISPEEALSKYKELAKDNHATNNQIANSHQESQKESQQSQKDEHESHESKQDVNPQQQQTHQ